MYHKKPAVFFKNLLDEIYPVRLGQVDDEDYDLSGYEDQLFALLENNLVNSNCDNREVARSFIAQVPEIKSRLDKDVQAILLGDPAATSELEVILAYPGFYAIAAYRIAHALYRLKVPLIPRLITEFAHSKTGIDIHPGAKIGDAFFIDHGTGVVIGETTVIGNYVRLYQGVTLGGISPGKTDPEGKRHPTIEDHVIIYAGATVLGGSTTIGAHSIIGGNVWLTSSVAAGSKVYYQPTVKSSGHEVV